MALNVEAYRNYAAEIQRTTAYSAHEVMAAQRLALNLGVLPGKLNEVTTAAIGLSEAYGMSLSRAMTIYGRASQGSFQSLSEYGIVLDRNANDAEKFNQLLALGAGKFSLAADSANNFTDRMTQMGNAVAGAKARLGAGLAPTMTTIAGAIKTTAEWFDKLNPGVHEFIARAGMAAAGVVAWKTAMAALTIAKAAHLKAMVELSMHQEKENAERARSIALLKQEAGAHGAAVASKAAAKIDNFGFVGKIDSEAADQAAKLRHNAGPMGFVAMSAMATEAAEATEATRNLTLANADYMKSISKLAHAQAGLTVAKEAFSKAPEGADDFIDSWRNELGKGITSAKDFDYQLNQIHPGLAEIHAEIAAGERRIARWGEAIKNSEERMVAASTEAKRLGEGLNSGAIAQYKESLGKLDSSINTATNSLGAFSVADKTADAAKRIDGAMVKASASTGKFTVGNAAAGKGLSVVATQAKATTISISAMAGSQAKATMAMKVGSAVAVGAEKALGLAAKGAKALYAALGPVG